MKRVWSDFCNLLSNFICNVLDRHRPVEKFDFDGCSLVSYCRNCGRKILRDSQGNWFSVKRRK